MHIENAETTMSVIFDLAYIKEHYSTSLELIRLEKVYREIPNEEMRKMASL